MNRLTKLPAAAHIYLIGIKGVGMTALAQLLKKQGRRVSGSDTAEIFFTDSILKKEKIDVCSDFVAENIPEKTDVIVYSAAYRPDNNAEMRAAVKRNIPLISLAEATAEIFNGYHKNIAVCGTHGKSTVTALLSFVLRQAGVSPSAIIGSAVPQLKGNALLGKSDVMTLEADEYQNKLALYQPHGVILNSIEYDHPDYFKNFAAYKKVFRDFVKKTPADGFVVANGADKNVVDVTRSCKCKVITYSQLTGNKIFNIKYLILNIKNKYQYFEVYYKGKNLGEFKIQLFGEHNVRNAVAVIAACLELKVPVAKIKKALAQFKGLARRMETLGKYNGALFIDDYAHHPTEVKATLAAARLKYLNKKITCVFMPHTFSRTQALFKDFSKSFSDADSVIILPIYASAREKRGSVTSKDLAAETLRTVETLHCNVSTVRYMPSIPACAAYLKKRVDKNDVVILTGAGNTFQVYSHIRAN